VPLDQFLPHLRYYAHHPALPAPAGPRGCLLACLLEVHRSSTLRYTLPVLIPATCWNGPITHHTRTLHHTQFTQLYTAYTTAGIHHAHFTAFSGFANLLLPYRPALPHVWKVMPPRTWHSAFVLCSPPRTLLDHTHTHYRLPHRSGSTLRCLHTVPRPTTGASPGSGNWLLLVLRHRHHHTFTVPSSYTCVAILFCSRFLHYHVPGLRTHIVPHTRLQFTLMPQLYTHHGSPPFSTFYLAVLPLPCRQLRRCIPGTWTIGAIYHDLTTVPTT